MRGAGVVGWGGAAAAGGAGAVGVETLAGGAPAAAGTVGRAVGGGATTVRGGAGGTPADADGAAGDVVGAAGGAALAGAAGGAGGAGGRIIGAGGRTVCGVMNRGAGAGGSGVGAGFGGAGGAGVAVGAAAAGLASTGAAGFGGTAVGRGAAGGGAAAACCFCVMSFRTSPGFEMCERSIFVLISSDSRPDGRAPLLDAASAADLKCARTFSASKSSSELECVFFSVTPTAGNTSRIALLLTSSSRARSLIRILLIRPFPAPPSLLKSSFQPHGVRVAYRPVAGGN